MSTSPAPASVAAAPLATRPSADARDSSPSPPPRATSDDEDDDDFDDTYGASTQKESSDGAKPPRPFFLPPLWLARRTACVQLLQSENIRSVVDFGCGAGAVLSLLALPAYHRDEFPPRASPSSDEPTVGNSSSPIPPARSRADKLALLRSLPPAAPRVRNLHLSRLVGVDADPSACERAAQVCMPARPDGRPDELRWEELRTEMWNGGVEVFNDAFEGVEAFVMTEVIEHLKPEALSRVPSLLFSAYRPRLVVITAPNHAYNAYFPPPSSSSSSSGRARWSRRTPQKDEEHPEHLFPDPTGRTNRVFRDETHTLEWTPSDFQLWCAEALREAGAEDAYDVEFTGVGSLEAYYRHCEGGVPFPPPSLALHPALAEHPSCTAPVQDPAHFFATQIAVFRRREAKGERAAREAREEEERTSRSLRVSPINNYAPLPSLSADGPPPPTAPYAARRASASASAACASGAPHALVAAAVHPAHPCTARSDPVCEDAIRAAVRGMFSGARRGEVLSLEEVWRYGDRVAPCDADREEEGQEGQEEKEPLRVLARGEVRAVVDALLDDDEWVFERVQPDAGAPGRAVERERGGMEALRVRWAGYEAALGEIVRTEAEEERRWAEERERPEAERGDNEAKTQEQAGGQPGDEEDREDALEPQPARDERDEREAQSGWGGSPTQLRADDPDAELAVGRETVSGTGEWWNADPW